jgi:hypothetical protein
MASPDAKSEHGQLERGKQVKPGGQVRVGSAGWSYPDWGGIV